LERVSPVIDAVKRADALISVKFVETDLSSMASVRKAAREILDDPEIKHIDVVINNAGVSKFIL
jgi:NAD(P)-dependent dehydrogenase (short-subunit alcohol dehydrogenase family)